MDRRALEAAIRELLRDYHVPVTQQAELATHILHAADDYAARCIVNAVSVTLTGKSI